MAALHWYIARNGNKVGPFNAAELRQLAAFRLLQPNELLWTEGLAKWVEARTLAWLYPPEGQKRFWLHVEGQTRGPYAADQIRAALAGRRITAETLICPENSKEWTPLRQTTEFGNFTPGAVTPSEAKLLANSLEVEEAELYLAGKGGDALARLIATLLALKKTHANNVTLVESLQRSIDILRAKRGEKADAPAPAGAH
jgi:hypothetical protein